MSKKERIYIRVTREQKKTWEHLAQKNELTLSGLVTHCMNNCETIFSKSHQQNVVDSMKENHVINNLLQHSDLSDKAKDIIAKEVRAYV